MWNHLAQLNPDPAADAAATGLGMLFAGTMLFVVLGVFVAFYVINALALMTIARKTQTPNEIWAWIPILNLILTIQIAQLPQNLWIAMLVCFIVSFVPLIGILGSLGFMGLMIYAWMKICERRGKPNWIAFLLLVPCVNFAVPLYVAYSDN